jgi:hypothetical protein
MSGHQSSDKTDRAIVRLLQAQGLRSRKVSAMYKPGEDLRVIVGDVERSVEVKCRAVGFHQLYDWLNQRGVLIVKADRQEPLVVLRRSLAAEIARAAEQSAQGTLAPALRDTMDSAGGDRLVSRSL